MIEIGNCTRIDRKPASADEIAAEIRRRLQAKIGGAGAAFKGIPSPADIGYCVSNWRVTGMFTGTAPGDDEAYHAVLGAMMREYWLV